jgi:hypothetical protein
MRSNDTMTALIPDPENPEAQAINPETGEMCPGVWVITPDGEPHHVGYVVNMGPPESNNGGANAGIDIYHPDPKAARWLTMGGTIRIGKIETDA